MTKSIRSRARRFCPANHDAHGTCGPAHVVSSLKHSTWLDFAQLASRGTNWWGESLEETFRMDPASPEEDSSRSHLRKFRGGYLADVSGRISRIMKIDLAKEGVMSYLHYSEDNHTLWLLLPTSACCPNIRLLPLLVKVRRSKPSLHEYEPIVRSCTFRSKRADLKPESEVHRWHQLICIESHNRSCRRAREKWCNSQFDTIRRCLYVQELNALIESRLSIHVLRRSWVLGAEAHASALNRQSGVVHLALSVAARNVAK